MLRYKISTVPDTCSIGPAATASNRSGTCKFEDEEWTVAIEQTQIPRRRYRDDMEISILGLGGMTLLDLERAEVDNIVAHSFERGMDYFDVASKVKK